MLEAIGLKVNRLIRLAYGPFALGTLGEGEIEEVGPRVVREQLAEHIDPENLPTGERPQYRSAPKSAARRAQEAAKIEADMAPVRAPKEKPVYKAGWATPKPKVKQPLKDKAAARSRDAAKARPKRPAKAKAKASTWAAVPARPGIIDRPTVGAKTERPRSLGARRAGAADRAKAPAPARAGAADRPPAAAAARPAGAERVRPQGPKRAGPPDRAKAAPARPGIVDRPKPAGPRPTGSPRAGGPGPGPRGPKPSASPRGKPGARPPGPPRSGGRGPRG